MKSATVDRARRGGCGGSSLKAWVVALASTGADVCATSRIDTSKLDGALAREPHDPTTPRDYKANGRASARRIRPRRRITQLAARLSSGVDTAAQADAATPK